MGSTIAATSTMPSTTPAKRPQTYPANAASPDEAGGAVTCTIIQASETFPDWSVALTVTLYVPGVVNWWMSCCPWEAVPSPKF